MPPAPQQPRHTELSILESYLLPPSSLPTILPYSAFIQLVPTQHRSHPHLKRLYRDLQFQRNVHVDLVRQNIEREVARGATLKGQLARRIAADEGRRHHHHHHQTRPVKKRKRTTTNQNGDDGDDSGGENELTDPAELAIDTTYLTSTMHPAHTSTSTSLTQSQPPSQQHQHHPLTQGLGKLYHTPKSLLSALESAHADLQTQIADLNSETQSLLADVTETVGALSDLRYGRFAANRPTVSGGTEENDETVEEEIVRVLEMLEGRVDGVNVGQLNG